MSEKKLTDVISLLIHTEDNEQYLMNIQDGDITLPSLPIFGNSWKKIATELIKQIFPEKNIKPSPLKMYRIWCPFQKSLMNFVYEVISTVEMHRRYKVLNSDMHLHLKWLPVSMVISNSLMIHKYWKGLVMHEMDTAEFVCELDESDVLVKDDNSDAVHQDLLEVSNITDNDQKNLYKEFITLCWPELLMSSTKFYIFCRKILSDHINQAFLEQLFTTADVSNQNYLTFRELLFIMSICDPLTPHHGMFADLRSRYIFKFYDRDMKGFLDFNDLKRIIRDIGFHRRQTLTDQQLDDDAKLAIE